MKRLLLLLLAVLSGCGELRHEDAGNWGGNESEFLTVIVYDMSSSFAKKMTDDGKAFTFSQAVLEQYFKDRMQDRILIAQISGNDHFLLWEGTQLRLRQEFPSAKEFGAFLRENSDPNGSKVHDGLVRTLEYVMSLPEVVAGRQRPVVFVLSDLVDSGSRKSERDVKDVVQKFLKQGGIIGLHYVDEKLLPGWKEEQTKSGSKWFCVGGWQVDLPTVPRWD